MNLSLNVDIGKRAIRTLIWHYLKKVLGYLLVGVLVNLILISIQGASVLFKDQSFGLNSDTIEVSIIIIIALVVPVFYLVLGHRHGTMAAGFHLADAYCVPVIISTLEAIFEKHKHWLSNLSESKDKIKQQLSQADSSLKNMSFMQHMFYQKALQKIRAQKHIQNLTTTVDQAFDLAQERGGSDNEKMNTIAEVLKSQIDLGFLKPKKRVLVGMITLNVVSVIIITNLVSTAATQVEKVGAKTKDMVIEITAQNANSNKTVTIPEDINLDEEKQKFLRFAQKIKKTNPNQKLQPTVETPVESGNSGVALTFGEKTK